MSVRDYRTRRDKAAAKAAEFPDLDFVVEAYDDERSYGPEVTFYTRSSSR